MAFGKLITYEQRCDEGGEVIHPETPHSPVIDSRIDLDVRRGEYGGHKYLKRRSLERRTRKRMAELGIIRGFRRVDVRDGNDGRGRRVSKLSPSTKKSMLSKLFKKYSVPRMRQRTRLGYEAREERKARVDQLISNIVQSALENL